MYREDGDLERPLIWDVLSNTLTHIPAKELPGSIRVSDWYPDGSAVLLRHEYAGRHQLFRYQLNDTALSLAAATTATQQSPVAAVVTVTPKAAAAAAAAVVAADTLATPTPERGWGGPGLGIGLGGGYDHCVVDDGRCVLVCDPVGVARRSAVRPDGTVWMRAQVLCLLSFFCFICVFVCCG